ncbi:hypothetical protein Pelo_3985 [Pelomyxa schiedti]|nr:hypothetical protein Pelo_3985 [Pelomyxa schiedti]
MLGVKPVDGIVLEPSPPETGTENLLKPTPEYILSGGSKTTTRVEPFHFLATLADTLTELQGCRFGECAKLADQHTTLSKELSEQVTLGHNLRKQIEEMQVSCSELMREHKTKWMLMRGLEGDEQFISLPCVWSQLSQLLPQAQQAVFDLVVSKAASSSSEPQRQQTRVTAEATTLPGCTAATTASSVNEGTVVIMCLVCDEREPNVCFQPCGHVVVCSEDTLGKQLDETCNTCKKVLGQTLTAQNSEAEIQQCSRNISELTKKMLGIKPVDGMLLEPSPPLEGTENLLKPTPEFILSGGSKTTTRVEPFHFLAPLTDTLTQLQGCRFGECAKLADQHTTLSKELSEQVTLGHNLRKQIEEMQGSCSELMREYKSKWVLMRGLEGDQQFISLPCVWSQLSQLLPQAQQTVFDLVVSKATSSSISEPQRQQTRVTAEATTLPGCTAATTASSVNEGTVVSMCLVCDEREPNVCFQPCGHVVVCSECSTVVKRCTKCRTPIHHKQSLS